MAVWQTSVMFLIVKLNSPLILPWVLDHQLSHKILGILRNILEQVLGEVEFALWDVTKCLLLCITTKRGTTSQKNIQQDSNRPANITSKHYLQKLYPVSIYMVHIRVSQLVIPFYALIVLMLWCCTALSFKLFFLHIFYFHMGAKTWLISSIYILVTLYPI